MTLKIAIIASLVMAAAVGSPARAGATDCASHTLTLAVSGMGSSQTTYDLFKNGSWTITAYYAVNGGPTNPLPLAITGDGGRGLLTFSATTSVSTPISPYAASVTWRFLIRSAAAVVLDSGALAVPVSLPNVQPCSSSDNAFVYKPVLTVAVVEDALGTGDVSIFDPGLPGWTLTAIHGAETVQVVTDDFGTATLVLDPLLDWSICEEPQAGWGQTYPRSGGCYSIPMTPRDMDALVFGNNHASAPGVVISSGGPVMEGGTWVTAGSFVDADPAWSATVDYGDGGGPQALSLNGATFALSHRYQDNGSFSVRISVTNAHGRTGTARTTAVVTNAPPLVQLTAPAPGALFRVGTPVTFAATFTDAGVLDTHSGIWSFANGPARYTVPATIVETAGSGTATASFTFATPGAYFVTLTITDKDGGTASAVSQRGSRQFVVVFPPEGMER